ncbi:hypothetical protein ACH5RR_008950, partial [Cinchona calisaya]
PKGASNLNGPKDKVQKSLTGKQPQDLNQSVSPSIDILEKDDKVDKVNKKDFDYDRNEDTDDEASDQDTNVDDNLEETSDKEEVYTLKIPTKLSDIPSNF